MPNAKMNGGTFFGTDYDFEDSDAQVKITAANGEITALKGAFELIEELTVVENAEQTTENIMPDLTWTNQGYISSDGTTHSATTLKYSGKIEVAENDVISVEPSLARLRYVCAYANGVAVSASGSNSSATSYTVPSGIDEIVITVYMDGNNAAPTKINKTHTTYTYTNILSDDVDEIEQRMDDVEDTVDDIVEHSKNVFNKSTVTSNAYIGINGIVQTSSVYKKWFVSDYINTNGATKLQSNINLASIIIYDEDDEIDSDNSYAGLNTPATLPFTLPATAVKIRISGWMSDLPNDVMMNFGEELLPFSKYGITYFNGEWVENAIKENPLRAKDNSASTASDYLSECKQALKKNVVVAYSANFTAFTSLLIGFTKTDTYATGYTDYFEITGTNFIMHRSGRDDVSWEHGLTIQDYIGVEITFDYAMRYTAKVTTNGGVYTQSNNIYLGASYYPFAIITGTSVANNKLSMSCKDLRKNIMMFGDSYFSNSSARWPYYFTDDERANLCMNAYAGESSSSATGDFDTLVRIGSPKYVLWCLGMNDGGDSDDTTPSSAWQTVVEHVIAVCAEKNITPILATIPSVPTINNRAKSAWVRSSGYRYIDFAAAVNSDDQGNWYTGMLSQDGVHPAEAGAKVLFARAITDFPELLIDN